MTSDEWLPCSELTLQGNLTIAGFAQKIWRAQPPVCLVHVHAASCMARIDWQDTSVIVSPSVIQHATLARWSDTERSVEPSAPVAQSAPSSASSDVHPSRADEILAELEPPSAPVARRRRAKNN